MEAQGGGRESNENTFFIFDNCIKGKLHWGATRGISSRGVHSLPFCSIARRKVNEEGNRKERGGSHGVNGMLSA